MLLIPTLFCPKSWEGMTGDETKRFCSYCRKHVHNLEALSASERLALFSSPAASICSRYQIALRRPIKGKEESYYLHLAKHGAAVAAVGSTLLVLWEMQGAAEKERFYRAAAPTLCPVEGRICEMPKECFTEHRFVTMGLPAVILPPESVPSEISQPPPPVHVDVKLDPIEIEKLIESLKTRPALPVPLSPSS